MLKKLFICKKHRWIQRLLHIHRVHHPRWSFGWTVPFWFNGFWIYYGKKHAIAYFENYGWKQVHKDSYHDSTSSGVY